MRKNRAIAPQDVLADAWIEVESGPVVQIDASLGRRFYVATLKENAIVNPPSNAKHGRAITIRFEQDATGGRTVTFNGFTAIGTVSVSTTASAVSMVDAVYNSAVGWELRPTTSTAAAGVDSVTGTAPITVDNTDPANPVVELDESALTGRLLAVTKLTASGTHTMHADMNAYMLDMVGGGGGGGGAETAVSSGSAGGGGAGGAHARKWVVGATSGVYTFLIGAAGTAGAAGASGGTGGDTKWDKDAGGGGAGYEFIVPGGSGGTGMAAQPTATFAVVLGGGQGGGSPEALDGLIRACGQPGSPGVVLEATDCAWSGNGGGSFMGGGARGRANTGANGEAPIADNHGAGGSGGLVVNGSAAATGGAGAAGCIIVYEYAI